MSITYVKYDKISKLIWNNPHQFCIKRLTPKPVNYFVMKIDHIDIVTSRQNENRPY